VLATDFLDEPTTEIVDQLVEERVYVAWSARSTCGSFIGAGRCTRGGTRAMHPFMLVPIGAGLVLVADLIGNSIAFKHRLINAAVTSIVWLVLFVGLVFIVEHLLGEDIFETQRRYMVWAAGGVVFAFVADVIGNYIAFDSRIRNSLVTAVVWAVLFFAYINIA
jgi:ABC-type Fe3+-siderophore transport system permease subunit